MEFHIYGKGVVCNVYYIESAKLDDITPLVTETGPSLKQLLNEHSDCIINVSRGFFADSSLYDYEFRTLSGEVITKQIFENEIYEQIDGSDEESYDMQIDGYFYVNHAARKLDATDSQVAIIEYHHFQNGNCSIDLGDLDPADLASMKFLCESVDRSGPSGEMDVATKATYDDGVVSTEEYEHSEYAIRAIEVNGVEFPLPEADFESSHSRVWLWIYDEDEKEHQLDFFGSQSLPDPWVVELIRLEVSDIEEGFDQDYGNLSRVHKFFNQQGLDWIKQHPEFVSKYQVCHTQLKDLLSVATVNHELPTFNSVNVKISTCTLLCMFFEAFGVSGYDPVELSEQDDMDLMLLDFETLALGNQVLLKSIQQSFCMHFDVITWSTVFGEESFPEMLNPSVYDAISFVMEVLDDPDASFNQAD